MNDLNRSPWPWRMTVMGWAFIALDGIGAFVMAILGAALDQVRFGHVAGVLVGAGIVSVILMGCMTELDMPARGMPRAERKALEKAEAHAAVQRRIAELERELQ